MKTGLPKCLLFTISMIHRCCDKDIKESFIDFIQSKFIDLKKRRGTVIATIVCLFHSAQLLLSHLIETTLWRFTMIKNYLRTAIRHFRRNKIYTGINVLGLSVALACALLIFLFIQDELSYDKFHENAETIYSVIEKDHYFNFHYRHVPTAVGPGMERFFPEVVRSARIFRQRAVVKYEDRMFNEEIRLVDPEFFTMFSFPVIRGNVSVLESDDAVILTPSSAVKYFGAEDPIDKTLTCSFGSYTKDFVVTALTADVPSNSTIEFDFLIHSNNYIQVAQRGPDALTSWTWPRCNAYIQLTEDATAESLLERLPLFVRQNFKQVEEERRTRGTWIEEGPTVEYWLQNMEDIYLNSGLISGNPFSDAQKSIILGGIGLLILIIACINFTNLSVGRASTRAKEIAVRKVTGAGKKNLIIQFWTESVVIVLLSMMLGFILVGFLLPQLNSIAMKKLTLGQFFNITNVLLFIVFGFVLGIAAGCFPALIMARFRPVEIIKGKFRIGGRNNLTKILIVFQFVVSILLLIATFTMGRQIRFIDTKDLGFDREGIVTINTMERDYETTSRIANYFKQKADSRPDIQSVSGCVFPFSTTGGEGTTEINGITSHFLFSDVYYNYAETMGMRLVAGRDFSEAFPTDVDAIVVNEEFVKQFEIENPIGFQVDDSPPNTIIGVVENYNYTSIREPVEPVIHMLTRRFGPHTLLIRISTADIPKTISALEDIWKDIQPNKPFNYSFFDEDIRKRYKDEQRWNSILRYASVLAILITCLGLVGITALTTSRRVKEIGVRKILGATASQITGMLIRNFLLLVTISVMIAWPLGYYAMHRWLQGYAYRTTIGWSTFLISGVLAFVIAVLTIGYQTVKAAAANPVNSLRDE